jgi:hypothetical protein
MLQDAVNNNGHEKRKSICGYYYQCDATKGKLE